MLKSFLRTCAGIALCALIVFAPELYQAANAPYTLSLPERVLLRVSLCSMHPPAADAFYHALTIYIKEHPAVHLRVTRTDIQELFAASEYPPDLYLFPQALSYDPARFYSLPDSGVLCLPAVSCEEETLLCAVSSDSAHPQQAHALFAYLTSAQDALDQ